MVFTRRRPTASAAQHDSLGAGHGFYGWRTECDGNLCARHPLSPTGDCPIRINTHV
jgi:hypothetical protein